MPASRGFLLTGAAFVAGSLIAFVAGGFVIGLAAAVLGAVPLVVGRRLRTMEPASIARGIPGTAEITSIRRTGTRVNRVKVVVEATAVVSIAGFDPYEATLQMVLHPTQLPAVEPGAVIAVLVEAEQPSRVVLDTRRGAIGRRGMLGDPTGPVWRTSADGIVEHGIAVTGTLHFSGPTGLVGSDLAAHLRGPEADDPVHRALVSFTPIGGKEVRTEILVRVPRGSTMPSRPGSPVPVRYLPDDPTVATIEWDQR